LFPLMLGLPLIPLRNRKVTTRFSFGPALLCLTLFALTRETGRAFELFLAMSLGFLCHKIGRSFFLQ